MTDRPDIPEELVEKAGNVLETCEEERAKALLHARPGEQFYPVDRRIDARKALEAVADPLRKQGAEEARESIKADLEHLGLVLCIDCNGEGIVTGTETGQNPDGSTYPVPVPERCPNCDGTCWVNQRAGEVRAERDQALAKGAEERERADRLEVENAELEDANRSLAKMRDRALEGNLGVESDHLRREGAETYVPLSEVREALLGEEAVEALAKKWLAHRGDWLLISTGERKRALDKARLHLKEAVDAAFPSTDSEGGSR